MNKLLYILAALTVSNMVFAQTDTKNYILTTTYQKEFNGGYEDYTKTLNIQDLFYYNQGADLFNAQVQAQVKIVDNILTFEIQGQWDSSLFRLKTGSIAQLNQSLQSESIELGELQAQNGSTGYFARINNGVLEFYQTNEQLNAEINTLTTINFTPSSPIQYGTNLNYIDCFGGVGSVNGSGSIYIENDVITLDLDAQLNQYCNIKLGNIQYLNTSSQIPDTELGYLINSSGGQTEYKAKIENNWLIFYSDTLTIPNEIQYSHSHSLISVTGDEKNETITYFDGLGRPVQDIAIHAGGQGQDIITPITYDDYGRQNIDYLPYSRDISSSDFEEVLNLNTQYLTKYPDDFNSFTIPNPFAQTVFEKSPLSSIKERAAPGFDWRYDHDNVVTNNIQVPIPLNFSTTVDTNLLSYYPNSGSTLGQINLTVSNSEINIVFDMIMQQQELKVGQIFYLDTAPYVIDNYFVGQLIDEQGVLIPYFVQIQNNYLVITTTDSNYRVEGLNCTLNLSVDIPPAEYITYQTEESTNNTIRYQYGTNSHDSDIKHFGVEFIGDSQETELVYIGNYSASQLYKTIIKDENWQPNPNPNIIEKDNTSEEYKDKFGRIVLKRAYENNIAHDTYYVYDKFANLTYVIPPLASDGILEMGGQGFRVASQVNYPWTDFAEVDLAFAENYNKKLIEYKNEDLLNADLENEYGGQGGFTVSTFENSDLVTLNFTFFASKGLSLKQGELLSLKDFGNFKDTELGSIVGDDFKYFFIIKGNAIVIEKSGEGKGELTSVNETFSSDTKLTYSQDYLWTTYSDVDSKFASEFEKTVSNLAKETNQSILSTFVENKYGAQGGLNISIDDSDIITININSRSNTPLKLKQGLVIPLNTKRNIGDRELGSISGSGYDYYFAIRENSLFINGYGSINNLNTVFTTPPPPSPPNITPGTVGGLCYIYHYDKRNRVINKKIPGKGWQYTVYDNVDRPILIQDAKMRLDNQWHFTKYDVFGRKVYTGIYTYIPTGSEANEQLELQSQVDAQNNPNWFENKISNYQTINGVDIYYSNYAFPNDANLVIHTINYYDDYSFDIPNELGIFQNTYNQILATNTKTLATGSKVRVLGTDNWITRVSYYDYKARPIYITSYNSYLNSIDKVASHLDFVGRAKETNTVHVKDSNDPIVVENRFTYDHVGRLLTQVQVIGNNEELIVNNHYDEYGQLESKNVGGMVAASTPEDSQGLQTIDYSYNIRGWLKAINEGTTSGDDLFGFKINYNTPEYIGVKSLFNGNISETYWQTANDHKLRSYDYHYDALNRIKLANYHGNYALVANSSETEDYSVSNINYDKNGNIKQLWRSGLRVETNEIGLIDVLNYTYEPRSNKLSAVNDYTSQDGFVNGSNQNNEYIYDVNGNMTKDSNKGIVDIHYNHLNLPDYISKPEYHQSYTEYNSINYTYDALGNKLRKKVRNQNNYNVSYAITDYNGDFIYKYTSNSSGSTPAKLRQIQIPEGYFEIVNPYGGLSSGEYVYEYKDHLGNVRLSYSDSDDSGDVDSSEILKESNYYPFGLEHEGYNNVVQGVRNNIKTYQSQEFTEELQLNTHEWKYRVSDPAIGRFWQVDPLAEKYEWMSTYQFSSNQPVHARELEGMESMADHSLRLQVAEKLSKRDGSDLVENYKDLYRAENGAMDIVSAFKSFFPENGAARDLIDHYAGETGTEYELSQKQLIEVYPLTDGGGNRIDLSLSNSDFLSVGDLSPGESKPFKDEVPVYAGTAGTLGNFTLTREGEISLNSVTGLREFTGTFKFNDIFDFNAADHRAWNVELQVTIARNLLPGIPFNVFGNLPVNQINGRDVTTTFNNITIFPANQPKPGPTEERQDETD
ncbi:DUF6443 domain-containing protein [Winogradskyella sp. PC D3.3]